MRQHRKVLTGSPFSARVGQWAMRSPIKSIQRGTVTVTNPAVTGTATITAVDPANSTLRQIGLRSNAVAANAENLWRAHIAFTNATTLTATVNTAGANTVVSFEVVEYWPGVIKSVQRGTFSFTVTNSTTTITAVDTAKSTLDWLGTSTTSTSTPLARPDWAMQTLTLTNATTITFSSTSDPNGSGLTWVVGYQATEWY